jgi:hypothetical protein
VLANVPQSAYQLTHALWVWGGWAAPRSGRRHLRVGHRGRSRYLSSSLSVPRMNIVS